MPEKIKIKINVDIKKLYRLYNSLHKKYSTIDLNTIESEKSNLYDTVYNNQSTVDFIKKSLTSYDVFMKNELKKMNLPLHKNKKCFDTYKVIKSIGKGAFGEAFLLERDNKQFAVKVIDIEPYIFDLNYPTLHNEINSLKKLGPLGISPKLYDYYICRNEMGVYKLYLFMEYMNMGSLSNYLDNPDNVFTHEMKRQLKSKIKQMHSYGIIHDDLHRGNVLVHKDEKTGKIDLFIGDFGLSKNKDKLIKNIITRNTLSNLRTNNENNFLYFLIFSKLITDYVTIDI